MTSHDDQSGRFKFAAQQARQSLDQARHYFDRAGEGNPYMKKIGGAFGGFRRFCNKYLPGGERTFWIALGLVLLVLFVRAILPNPNAATGGRGSDFNAPQPVGVAAAKVGDIDITRDAQGAVTPLSTVTVRPQVSGQLVRVGFTEGQMVKAGDLLAQIDPRPYQAALDQARGQLARDQASLNNAQLDLKRDQALYAAQATSQQTLDTQMALVKQEQGVVMSDRANIEIGCDQSGLYAYYLANNRTGGHSPSRCREFHQRRTDGRYCRGHAASADVGPFCGARRRYCRHHGAPERWRRT